MAPRSNRSRRWSCRQNRHQSRRHRIRHQSRREGFNDSKGHETRANGFREGHEPRCCAESGRVSLGVRGLRFAGALKSVRDVVPP